MKHREQGAARVRVVTGLLAVAFIALAAVAASDFLNFLDSPVQSGADTFLVAKGSSFTRVANELEERGIIDNAAYFRIYARYKGNAESMQAGEYRITTDLTPASLYERLISGDVRLYPFTIVEGWNRWEVVDAVAQDAVLAGSFTDEDWASLLDELGAEVTNPEGLFLPETYLVPRGGLKRDLLRDAYQSMQRVLAEEWAQRSEQAAPTTPYEALILASIIEKETARADERQRISGVFTRRLALGMRLQTDPTVIYGLLPDFNGDLTRNNLRSDTPYNTYTRGGLPPTPIAMPGRDAIYAALHPADGDELYFVATGLGDGSHAFSRTLEEHEAAVQEYLKRLRSRD